jgi:hypothetical protein
VSRVGLPRALAVLAFLVPAGTMGAPGAESETHPPRRPTSPYAAAAAERARAQVALTRKQASPPAAAAEAKPATQAPPRPAAPPQAKPAPRQAPPRPGAVARAKPAPTHAAPRPAPAASEARSASDRVAAATHASALFAQHTWAAPKPAPPPPPPPAPEPPPPPPTAPPLPYTFLGSYAPKGAKPVYFMARGDRVVDAHVGDKLDGVYELESADGAQLVFVYLPLNIRQNLAAGASK